MSTPLYDAHCHPTDTMSTVDEISTLKTAGLCIMATRSTDQENVGDTATKFPEKVVPCFGFHPWFVHSIYDDSKCSTRPDKTTHFRSVLRPEPDETFINGMPDLVPLSKYLDDIRGNLKKYKRAMVGEVGLDRAFRIPDPQRPREDQSRHILSKYRTSTEHQAMLLAAQLRIAAEFGRACSLHGVQAAGYLFTEISKLWEGHEKPSKTQLRKQAAAAAKAAKLEGQSDDVSAQAEKTHKPFPPRICLHSYSGSQDMVGPWVKSNVPAAIFFSFSKIINGRYDRWAEVVQRVPDDQLLIESDYHDAKLIDGSLQEAFDFVCKIKGWEEEQGRKILERNWLRFVGDVE